MDSSTSNDDKKWVEPRISSKNVASGSILGVWLAEDEDVDWQITYSPEFEPVVTGYTIKKKNE